MELDTIRGRASKVVYLGLEIFTFDIASKLCAKKKNRAQDYNNKIATSYLALMLSFEADGGICAGMDLGKTLHSVPLINRQ